MAWILPLLLILSSCSCLPCFGKRGNERSYPIVIQKVDPLPFSEVVIPYAVELSHTKRLRFEDSKIYYEDFVERFRVIFSSQNILELCEARDLLVTVTEELLARLNESPNVVVNFDHFPITADDLELYFSFESHDIEYNDGTYIAWMSLHDGTVRYYSGYLKNPRIDFWDARVEPYYKSLEFVQISRAAEESFAKKTKNRQKSDDTRTFEL